MGRCHYCGYCEGGHNVACPESKSGDAAKVQAAHKIWDAGYQMGRSGKPEPTDASATYSLGYGRGVGALEEAENGEPWSGSDGYFDEADDRIDEYMDLEFGD